MIKGAIKERSWRDIPLGFAGVYFHYRPREIKCRKHGRIQEEIPWAGAYSRETYRFEYLVVKYCRDMSQKKAAEQMKIAKSTLSDKGLLSGSNPGTGQISYSEGTKRGS